MNLTARTARLLLAAATVLASAAAGCSDGGDREPAGDAGTRGALTSRPAAGRPPVIPASARAVESDTSLALDTEDPLTQLSCEANVLVVESEARTVYAALPCDRALPPDILNEFVGEAVIIEIDADTPGKVFLRSEAGESAEFTVDGVWIEGDADVSGD